MPAVLNKERIFDWYIYVFASTHHFTKHDFLYVENVMCIAMHAQKFWACIRRAKATGGTKQSDSLFFFYKSLNDNTPYISLFSPVFEIEGSPTNRFPESENAIWLAKIWDWVYLLNGCDLHQCDSHPKTGLHDEIEGVRKKEHLCSNVHIFFLERISLMLLWLGKKNQQACKMCDIKEQIKDTHFIKIKIASTKHISHRTNL